MTEEYHNRNGDDPMQATDSRGSRRDLMSIARLTDTIDSTRIQRREREKDRLRYSPMSRPMEISGAGDRSLEQSSSYTSSGGASSGDMRFGSAPTALRLGNSSHDSQVAQVSPPLSEPPLSAGLIYPAGYANSKQSGHNLQVATSATDAQMQAAGFYSNAPPTPLKSASSAASSSRSSSTQGSFRLICRQQPQHARMCGFGEKDRRPLDPPPILQVVQIDNNGIQLPGVSKEALLTVHVTLWDEAGVKERSLLVSPATPAARKPKPPGPGQPSNASDDAMDTAEEHTEIQLPPAHMVPEVPVFAQASARGDKLTRVLMGSLVASPSVMLDDNDRECTFFVFPDLSVRTEGRYRLRFSLFKLEMSDLMTPGARANVLSECMTDPFTVYPAKTFPGMLRSTELTKALARQGFKVQIRNDVRVKKHQLQATGAGIPVACKPTGNGHGGSVTDKSRNAGAGDSSSNEQST
ncbi:hypothetical protein PYCC9005_003611 [Savitreella phatthalungensis]